MYRVPTLGRLITQSSQFTRGELRLRTIHTQQYLLLFRGAAASEFILAEIFTTFHSSLPTLARSFHSLFETSLPKLPAIWRITITALHSLKSAPSGQAAKYGGNISFYIAEYIGNSSNNAYSAL